MVFVAIVSGLVAGRLWSRVVASAFQLSPATVGSPGVQLAICVIVALLAGIASGKLESFTIAPARLPNNLSLTLLVWLACPDGFSPGRDFSPVGGGSNAPFQHLT